MLLVAAVAAACSSGATVKPAAATAHERSSSPTSSATPRHRTSPTPRFTPTESLVERAYWVREPEGWRIRVMPSIYGRNHAPQAPAATLREALHLAGPRPLKLTFHIHHSLLNQLRCHADFAPRKPLWDLETWRPDVGFYQVVEALCNPGGGS